MRRENRKNNLKGKTLTDKIIIYGGIGIAIFAVIVFALFMYSKSLSDEVKNSTMTLEKMANITDDSQNVVQNQENTDTEPTTTEIGRTIEELENESNTNSSNMTTSSTNTTNQSNNVKNNDTTKNKSTETTNTSTNMTTTNNNQTSNNTTAQNLTEKQEPKVQKELKFQKPVEGDVVREYAKENLIYSETLQEWVTHTGIDIKAEKTTVVNAAEEGTVKSIKNDTRYGLTVVIEHDNNYQTVYSNLLTSEFVVEGEKVEKGQAIGTVGNTAVFEIVDEPHLHFEIIKESLPVDPSIYLN